MTGEQHGLEQAAGFLNLAVRQLEAAEEQRLEVLHEVRHLPNCSSDDFALTQGLTNQCLEEGRTLERRVSSLPAIPDDDRAVETLQLEVGQLSGCLRTFDSGFGPKRRALDAHIEQLAANTGITNRFIDSIGAVRINVGRAVLQYANYYVTMFELKDINLGLPPQPESASAVGQPSAPEQEALPPTDEHDRIEDPEVSLEISAEDLLQHPEVRRIKLLEEISRATIALATIESRRQDLVRQARELDTSWARIGAAAEITSQAAYRKWDNDARAKHRAYGRASSDGDD